MSLQHSNQDSNSAKRAQPPVTGAIIDAQGREVPITEQMIQEACKELEASRVKKVQKG
ncbi:MAG: PA1571 family protein [Pseudomonas farsensis]|uniref:PA1571 family protein n=1 Tax=Pseudomonas farsensis TaxID=2745492 RepID=UPI003C7E08DF